MPLFCDLCSPTRAGDLILYIHQYYVTGTLRRCVLLSSSQTMLFWNQCPQVLRTHLITITPRVGAATCPRARECPLEPRTCTRPARPSVCSAVSFPSLMAGFRKGPRRWLSEPRREPSTQGLMLAEYQSDKPLSPEGVLGAGLFLPRKQRLLGLVTNLRNSNNSNTSCFYFSWNSLEVKIAQMMRCAAEVGTDRPCALGLSVPHATSLNPLSFLFLSLPDAAKFPSPINFQG